MGPTCAEDAGNNAHFTVSSNTLASAKVLSEAISKLRLDDAPVCKIHVTHDSGTALEKC